MAFFFPNVLSFHSYACVEYFVTTCNIYTEIFRRLSSEADLKLCRNVLQVHLMRNI